MRLKTYSMKKASITINKNVRVRPKKASAEDLMLLNCRVGEKSDGEGS